MTSEELFIEATKGNNSISDTNAIALECEKRFLPLPTQKREQ
jgi:hypothetical protein